MTDLSEVRKRHTNFQRRLEANECINLVDEFIVCRADRAWLLAHIDEVRAAALEEAAKRVSQLGVHAFDRGIRFQDRGDFKQSSECAVECSALNDAVTAIRALKTKPEEK